MDIITSINTDFYNELKTILSVEEIDLMQMAVIITNSVPLMKYVFFYLILVSSFSFSPLARFSLRLLLSFLILLDSHTSITSQTSTMR
jgi:hypothetical protein